MQVLELMPLATLKAEHAKAGASIPVPVDLGDINEEGYHATVESIEACPKIESGPGRVVLTTITHLNNYVFHLTLKNAQGQTETLGVTGFHKLYTEDHGWMSAGTLTIGEQIRGDHGDLTVVSLASDPGVYQVYNMTVEADHVYYVGDLTALSHNAGDCNPYGNGGNRLPDDRIQSAPENRGEPPIGDDGNPVELHHDGQSPDSPLDEMTRTDHRGAGNFSENHPNTGQSPSQIDRNAFSQQRTNYWNWEWDNGRWG